MNIVPPEVELFPHCTYEQALDMITTFGHLAYLSEKRGETPKEQEAFIRARIAQGHESILEHVSLSFVMTCNRAVANELVRHRIAAYTQESTQFCNYNSGRFGGQLTFVLPEWFGPSWAGSIETCAELDALCNAVHTAEALWLQQMFVTEVCYKRLIGAGLSAQDARGVLPLDLKTTVAATYNIRQFRHVLNVRAIGSTGKPDAQMQELMTVLLCMLQHEYPVFFEDFKSVEITET